jgi:hypothetical protein
MRTIRFCSLTGILMLAACGQAILAHPEGGLDAPDFAGFADGGWRVTRDRGDEIQQDAGPDDDVTADHATPRDAMTPDSERDRGGPQSDTSVPAKDIGIPDTMPTPDLRTPDLPTPDLLSPDLLSPDLQVPDQQTPDLSLATCSNSVKDPGETDIDCGGHCPKKCSQRRGCHVDQDCQAGLTCFSNVCSQCRQGPTSISLSGDISCSTGLSLQLNGSFIIGQCDGAAVSPLIRLDRFYFFGQSSCYSCDKSGCSKVAWIYGDGSNALSFGCKAPTAAWTAASPRTGWLSGATATNGQDGRQGGIGQPIVRLTGSGNMLIVTLADRTSYQIQFSPGQKCDPY